MIGPMPSRSVAWVGNSRFMNDVAFILLGAGAATRMGRPKQLLEFRGRPLIRHCAEEALRSVCRPLVVVLGAHATEVERALSGLPVRVVLNPCWEEGMGTSIQAGLTAVRSDSVSGVILGLADQPLVTARHIDALVEVHRQSGKDLIASSYADTVGVPALFGRSSFAELAQLEPAQGCKGILMGHRATLVSLPCPEALCDVDTPTDYEKVAALD